FETHKCCFVYYLVFKDQAAVCDRLSTLPEPDQPVKKFFSKIFVGFCSAPIRWIVTERLPEHR
ncbi:hypothetical protein, partial [Geoanaerobacter pelophilus]|uniref:hypothetical protein n=1 Tax=Geoanaerobacter pelophilus TaxID=60036 RepID=UPI001BDF75F0